MPAVIVGCVAAIAIIGTRSGAVVKGRLRRQTPPGPLFPRRKAAPRTFQFTWNLKDKRIALAGSGEISSASTASTGRPLGTTSSTSVRRVTNGTYRLITNCREFINTINEGDHDYLITSGTPGRAEADYWFPVRAWVDGDLTRSSSSRKTTSLRAGITPYKINGKLDPDRCAKLDQGSDPPGADRRAPGDQDREAEAAPRKPPQVIRFAVAASARPAAEWLALPFAPRSSAG